MTDPSDPAGWAFEQVYPDRHVDTCDVYLLCRRCGWEMRIRPAPGRRSV